MDCDEYLRKKPGFFGGWGGFTRLWVLGNYCWRTRPYELWEIWSYKLSVILVKLNALTRTPGTTLPP